MISKGSQQKWKILARAWKDTGPPAAPSPNDIINYICSIPKVSTRVLVLGCTPALRNALVAEHHNVISVDITKEMIEMTTKLVSKKGNDFPVQGDWLQLPLRDKSIDAVIGDKVLGNVDPNNWECFFSEIKRVLHPKGVLLTRASPHGKQQLELPKYQTFSEMIWKWLTFHKAGMDLNNACAGLWEDCMDMSTKLVTPYIGTQQLSRILPDTKAACIREANEDPDATPFTRYFIQKYWTSRNLQWSAYTVEGILSAASSYFDCLGTYAASDYPEGARQPIFHFVAKN